MKENLTGSAVESISLSSCHAVHREDYTGDISGLVAGKEYKGVGNVLGLTQTTEGTLGDEGIDDSFGNGLHHIGFRDAGGNCVYPDTLGTKLTGKGESEAVYGELACGIGKAAGLAVFAYHGGCPQDN